MIVVNDFLMLTSDDIDQKENFNNLVDQQT